MADLSQCRTLQGHNNMWLLKGAIPLHANMCCALAAHTQHRHITSPLHPRFSLSEPTLGRCTTSRHACLYCFAITSCHAAWSGTGSSLDQLWYPESRTEHYCIMAASLVQPWSEAALHREASPPGTSQNARNRDRRPWSLCCVAAVVWRSSLEAVQAREASPSGLSQSAQFCDCV